MKELWIRWWHSNDILEEWISYWLLRLSSSARRSRATSISPVLYYLQEKCSHTVSHSQPIHQRFYVHWERYQKRISLLHLYYLAHTAPKRFGKEILHFGNVATNQIISCTTMSHTRLHLLSHILHCCLFSIFPFKRKTFSVAISDKVWTASPEIFRGPSDSLIRWSLCQISLSSTSFSAVRDTISRTGRTQRIAKQMKLTKVEGKNILAIDR